MTAEKEKKPRKRLTETEKVVANAKKALAKLEAKHDALVNKTALIGREMDKLSGFIKANSE